MTEPIIGEGTTPAGGPLIKDTDTASFEADVIHASRETPVIVDFWAPWCEPCKQLTPVLEREVRAAAGEVQLVKVNIDENQELAQHLRIQSIPTVYGFQDGQLVDGFNGVVPESQIRQFIDRLCQGGVPGREGSVTQALNAAKDAFADGDYQRAGGLYQQVAQQQPDNLEAAGGIIRCLVQLGHVAEARQLMDQIPADQRTHPDLATAVAALEIMGEGASDSEVQAHADKVAADPANHQARFEYAEALFSAGRQKEAVDELLHIFRADRAWNNGAAKEQLLKFFEALGHEHPVTMEGRRTLSSMLFS